MAIERVSRIDSRIPVRHVLASVSDKTGLETLIPGLLRANPNTRIYSTGGTYRTIESILGPDSAGLVPISEYTGQPEMRGGLVKTLDFRIYVGLLSETYNDDHRSDLARLEAIPFDLVLVNLYPFGDAVQKEGSDVEDARGNIDIGGPAMLRAAAKNFLRVLPVCDPGDYSGILAELENGDGSVSLDTRLNMAKKAFDHTASYDRAIADYLSEVRVDELASTYTVEDTP